MSLRSLREYETLDGTFCDIVMARAAAIKPSSRVA
jgi:hypothetical protein